MLKSLSLLLLASLFVSSVNAGRCSARGNYRESRGGQITEIRRPRLCRGSGSFIGEDYWTTVGYDGIIRDGRSQDDFLSFGHSPSVSNGFIAYWITRTRYGNVHYEAFGHAYIRDDRRICAWFVGLNKEIVETCGGFRVLSRNRFRPNEPNPFEWVQGGHLDAKSTLGFHEHRIAKTTNNGEVFYGDARIADRNFQGVAPSSQQYVELTPNTFLQECWLLSRRPDAVQPEELRVDPRSDPRDPRYDPRYDPRRAQQQQREYDERYQQHLLQQQQQQQQQQRQQQEVQDSRRTDPRFVNDTVDTYRDQQQPQYAAQESGQNYVIIVDQKPEPRREVEPPVNTDTSVRFARIRPPTVVKDQYGNLYERRQENGHVIYYADPHVQRKQLTAPTENRQQESNIVDARYQNAQWLRQRENMNKHYEDRRRQEEQAREQREREVSRRQDDEVRNGYLYVPDQQVPIGQEIVHIQQEQIRIPGAHHIGSGVLPEGTKFVGQKGAQSMQEDVEEQVEETKRTESRVAEAEEKPVPFEKEDEVPNEPEKLPPPRPVVQEDNEDEEEDEPLRQ